VEKTRSRENLTFFGFPPGGKKNSRTKEPLYWNSTQEKTLRNKWAWG